MAGKKYNQWKKSVSPEKKYSVAEAVTLVSVMKSEKFDQTVDISLKLGVDAKQAEQQVRGAVALPHGIGKSVVVIAFAKGENEQKSREAGADFVGGEDLVKKISDGWMEFDKVVATPDMMPVVSKLGKLLGPRGLMPNPKTGTVTADVAKAVRECKAGRVEFRTDKAGIVHCPIGKISFGPDKLKDNLMAVVETIVRMKPSSSKGIYLRSLAVSGTHTPAVAVDTGVFL